MGLTQVLARTKARLMSNNWKKALFKKYIYIHKNNETSKNKQISPCGF